MASSLSALRPCQNVMSTGSVALSSADTGQSGSAASGVVVGVALVAGGVVAGCSPGTVLAGGSVVAPGTVVACGGAVVGRTAAVVAVGVSLPATMIELPEPHAAAVSAAETTS